MSLKNRKSIPFKKPANIHILGAGFSQCLLFGPERNHWNVFFNLQHCCRLIHISSRNWSTNNYVSFLIQFKLQNWELQVIQYTREDMVCSFCSYFSRYFLIQQCVYLIILYQSKRPNILWLQLFKCEDSLLLCSCNLWTSYIFICAGWSEPPWPTVLVLWEIVQYSQTFDSKKNDY